MTGIFVTPRARRLCLAQAIVLALAVAAHAEDAPTSPSDASTQQQPADTLGTVVVTAEKRSEDVQTVPMSVGVIDQSDLQNLHATQLSDYAAYVPGLTVANGGTPGQAMVGIRGIAPLSSGSTVATYIDETPLGTSGLYGGGSTNVLDLLPDDIQSVEVLRGPQGTLYGASALGGVVRYVTKLPDLDNPQWHVGADVFGVSGSGDLGQGGRVGFGVPIITDELAVSFSAARQNTPGFTDNVLTGAKDQNAYAQSAARLALLWKPSENVSLSVSAMQSMIDASSASNTALDPVTLKPMYGDLKDDNYFAEPYRNTTDYFNVTLNVNLGFADFVSSSSYSHTDTTSGEDVSQVYGVAFPAFGVPAGLSDMTYALKLYKATQEFRLASKSDDRIEWLVGVFWTREDSQQNQAVSAQAMDYTSIDGLDPLAVVGFPSTYREYAGYGDLTWKFTSSFDVTAGVRWAHNAQTFSEITSGALEGLANVGGTSSEDVFTYSFSPRWRITPDTMLYARVASGYEPGGPNIALPGVPPQVNSSTLTNYEAGLKSTLDDHRLTLDADLYDIQWDKIQVSEATGGVTYLANGGTARSRGVEFSALYMLAAGLRVGLNGAYTDAVLTQAIPSIGGVDGARLGNVPKWAASATADYSFPVGGGWNGRVGGGLRYVGAMTSGVAGSLNSLPEASYAALDLNADLSNDHWTVRFFAKNLTDKRVYTNLTALPNALTGEVGKVNGVPLAPRTIGVGFDLKL